ncbi:MAG: GNAT family N-acetyltransferase [Chitinophagaceae bacterium]
MNFILETPRLYLRQMTPADAPNAFELNSDPEVIRYTGDDPFESIQAAATFLINYKDYEKYGVGRWAVIRKEDDAWLGWCGLKWLAEKGEIDLGYRLLQRYWNKGYATEAAKACVAYGFQKFEYSFIVGRVLQENISSIKVLEKAGLSFVAEESFHGEEGFYYRIDRPKA